MSFIKRYFDPIILLLSESVALYFVLYYLWQNSGIAYIANYVNNQDGVPYHIFIGLNVFYFVCVNIFFGIYKRLLGSSRLDMFINIFKSTLIGLVILAFFPMLNIFFNAFIKNSYGSKIFFDKMMFVFEYFFAVFLPIAVIHIFYYSFRKFLFKYNIGRKRAIIIGCNDYGKSIFSQLKEDIYQIFNVVGFVDENSCDDENYLGDISKLPEIVKQKKISTIIFANQTTDQDIYHIIFKLIGNKNLSYYIAPDILELINGYVKTQQLSGPALIEILPEHMSLAEANIKRLIDIFMSLFVLIFFSPLFVVIGVAIKLNSKGPVFYKQERLGRFWRPFMIYKFRTMYIDAEKRGVPQWATEDDPRITKVGKFLRKTRLDELPQFINILKGEMSVVGPRPEREYFVKQLIKEVRFYERRLIMKPGLTGWAQVHLEYDSDIESVKNKVLYDLFYLENMSIKLDLKIIFKTFFVVIFGKGAH